MKRGFKGVTEENAEKMAAAMQLRKGGMGVTAIAPLVGCSIAFTSVLIKKGLQSIIEEPAQQLRTMELDRLDAMWVKAFERAQLGDIKSIEACIKIMERRGRLVGLDAPTKTAATDPTGEKEAAPLVQIYMPDNGRDPAP